MNAQGKQNLHSVEFSGPSASSSSNSGVAPFDSVAAEYDEDETSPVTRDLRRLIREAAFPRFKAGEHILELTCGTGNDAIAFAQRGVRVTATDISGAMLDQARRKVDAAGLSNSIELRRLDLEEISSAGFAASSFDGLFSNFGGLNCAPNLEEVFRVCAVWLKPEKYAIFCFVGKHCPWEMVSYLSRGNFRGATRRLHEDGTIANIGTSTVKVWYYSPSDISRMMSPWYSVEDQFALNVVSPGQNCHNFIRKHPALVPKLLRMDDAIRRSYPFRNWGDQFVVVAKRRGS